MSFGGVLPGGAGIVGGGGGGNGGILGASGGMGNATAGMSPEQIQEQKMIKFVCIPLATQLHENHLVEKS